MNPLWIRALILLVAFGTGWTVNGWRLGEEITAMERDQAQELAAAIETARLKERAMTKQTEEARNAATKRETALRRDAAGAHQSADRLRDDLAEFRRSLPGLADDAIRQRADILAELFGACTAEYRGMAEASDRITSDRQTLMEAWPK